MEVAIVGAGWYGCHMAKILKNRDVKVTIFEKDSHIFSQASSKNQNRLHLGFHYPRSCATREQFRSGYFKFMDQYGHLQQEIKSNIYGVDDRRSLLDFETYKAIMRSSKLEFTEGSSNADKFINITGFLEVKEGRILFSKARDYFFNFLKEEIFLNVELKKKDIENKKNSICIFGKKYDYLINCTWGQFRLGEKLDVFFEPAISLLYESRFSSEGFAPTVMDGQFFSLYPYEDKLYTLTSVKNTPLGKYKELNHAIARINTLCKYDMLELKKRIELEVRYYYPSFLDSFKYVDFYTSIKTKQNVNNDARQSIVELNGREINVISGKIDTVFFSEEKICNYIFSEKKLLKQA